MLALPYEIWRDISGYEGLYQISNLGRVKSFNRYIVKNNGVKELRKGRILKSVLLSTGYFCVTLCKDNYHKIYSIHRLIAETFIPNPDNLPQVDHINTIRNDNRIENLRWVDSKGQMNNYLTKQHCSDSQKAEKAYWYGIKGKEHPCSKPILQLSKKQEIINQFVSAVDAENKTGISRKAICRCLKGYCNTSGGYMWQYVN